MLSCIEAISAVMTAALKAGIPLAPADDIGAPNRLMIAKIMSRREKKACNLMPP